MKQFKVVLKPYLVEEECPNCEGKGYIEVDVFDKFSNEKKKLAYACPQCKNTKKIILEAGSRYEVEEIEVVGKCTFNDGMIYEIEEMPEGGTKNSVFLEDGRVYALGKSEPNTYFSTEEEAEKTRKGLQAKYEEESEG